MRKPNQTIYLPIRAFGDFIISASVIKDSFLEKIPILLPDYLTQLFFSINGDKYFDVTGSIALNDHPAFYELFRVKDVKNFKRLINDIKTINLTLNKEEHYILDYSSKRLFFTQVNFDWPSAKENIYEGKLKLFKQEFLLSDNPVSNFIKPVKIKNDIKVLIVPDSRIKQKSINGELLKAIINHFDQRNIHIAYFAQNAKIGSGNLYYSNFKELIDLINACDLVISGESLPYHLANYLGKPHYVIYNKSRHFKTAFMTPFMIRNNCYSIFNGRNNEVIIKDIEKILHENK